MLYLAATSSVPLWVAVAGAIAAILGPAAAIYIGRWNARIAAAKVQVDGDALLEQQRKNNAEDASTLRTELWGELHALRAEIAERKASATAQGAHLADLELAYQEVRAELRQKTQIAEKQAIEITQLHHERAECAERITQLEAQIQTFRAIIVDIRAAQQHPAEPTRRRRRVEPEPGP